LIEEPRECGADVGGIATELERVGGRRVPRVNAALVSVVMPAFNSETFIAEGLDSVLAQTYRPVEVIVVDDGSTDRTAEIAADRGASVFRQSHRGLAATRNAGLRVCNGVYWTIVDADDVIPADRLSCQVAHLQDHPDHGMVLGLTEAFVSPGEPRPAHYHPVWDDGPYPGHSGTLLARREVLEVVGPYDEALALGDDVEWLVRARDAGVRSGVVDHVLLRYRIHADNTSRDPRANQMAMLKIARKAVRRRRELRLDP
jgi:glycosyltransferase involved in cell wall biosynthesis